jgi:hypothetical protein
MDCVHLFKISSLGPQMRQLTPEWCAEKVLNERLESLGFFRVSDSRVVLKVVRVIYETKFAHRTFPKNYIYRCNDAVDQSVL